MNAQSVRALAWIALLIPLTAVSLAADVEVPRWQPHDVEFSARVETDNPFRVTFSATVTGPGGRHFDIPGFFDGNQTWKARISPTEPGAWSILTHSNVAELDGKQSTFVCVANPSAKIHGVLRVDPDHPHQFIYEDGSRYFPMGYECDWLWALDMNDPALPTVNPFLNKLEASGFTFIILNTYAHDTDWRKGTTGPDDFGPPTMFAWEGSNQQPDHSRFNLAYWRHYDRIIDAMYRRGIVAHVFIKVYNKQVHWPANGSAEDDQYFRWLIARYAAYPNISWDLAKEAHNEKDVAYKLNRLQFIRENDPYHRLLSVHDDRANYDRGAYDTLLDYRSDQQHSAWRQTMLAHLVQHEWPVINTEFGYEHGPGGLKDKTYSQAQAPEEVSRRAWEVYMAGGFGAYYYTYTAWDVIRPADTPPGYAYFKHLRDFFESTSYWRLSPAQGIANEGYCLADPGREYAVFLNSATPFALKLEGLKTPLRAQWYRPFTGERQDAGLLNGGTIQLTPPPAWRHEPVALHVGTPAR